MKIAKKDLYKGLIAIVALLIVFLCQKDFQDIVFYANIVLLYVIVMKAQFSIVTIWAVVANYVLLNVYFFYKTGLAYGKLGYIEDLYITDINIALICFNIILLCVVYVMKFLQYEKSVLSRELKITKRKAEIMGILAMIMAYIAFPSLNFTFDNANRFQALLPGNFWNHFSIILLIFALYRFKESHLVKICLFMVTAWFLLHSERVDIVGLYSYILVKYCSRKGYKFSFKVVLPIFIAIVGAFWILIYIGNSRVGQETATSMVSLLYTFVRQATASDVGHGFNGTFEYIHENGYLYGKTFITYLQGIVPMVDQPFRAGHIIQDYYGTAGGEFILIEPILNFSYMGIFVCIGLYIVFLNQIAKKNTEYLSIVYCFLIASAFRYIWYGLTYIETGVLYLLPFCFFMYKSRLGLKRSIKK